MWIERKYISLLSSHVRNFKKIRNDLYRFSCPFCGDSQRDKRKARGYVFRSGNTLLYKCHNCLITKNIPSLLNSIDPTLYQEYIVEKFRDNKNPSSEIIKDEQTVISYYQEHKKSIDSILLPISKLENNHPAKKYLENRLIPLDLFDHFFYCEDLSVLKDTFPKYKDVEFLKEDRVVLPIFNRQHDLIGITARAIGKSKLRYVMLHKNDREPLIYGIDKLNVGKKVYAFEGIFDSLYVDNSVAVDGADFSKLSNLVPKDQIVIIFDRQPRNNILIKKIEHISDEGYSMFVWPKDIREKDVNKWISERANYNTLDKYKHILKDMIDENTYSGLKLKIKIADWKQI